MKSFVFLVIYLFWVASDAIGQITTSPIERDRNISSVAKDEDYFKQPMEDKKRFDQLALKALSPSEVELKKYSTFLKQPKTGIIKLFKPKKCGLNDKVYIENRAKFAKECPTAYFQGNGFNFSFRRKEYVNEDQADIVYKNDVIFSGGLLNQGIMVNIGEFDFESVTLETKGVDFLNNYTPATLASEADAQKAEIQKGLEKNGFVYARGFKSVENTNFALRVIAYKADLKSYVKSFELTITFDPFYGDLRDDIIIAFRLVRIDEEGVTLIWKELQRKPAPTIILKK